MAQGLLESWATYFSMGFQTAVSRGIERGKIHP